MLRKSAQSRRCHPGRHPMQAGQKPAAQAFSRLMIALSGVILCVGLALPQPSASQPYTDPSSALQDYVAAPDAAYEYALAQSSAFEGYTAHLLRMTSQEWREPAEAPPAARAHRPAPLA